MSRVKLYKGIDQFGNIRSGKIEVPEGMSAYEFLISQGIKPLKIEDVSESLGVGNSLKESPPKRMLPFC
jgi:type II secretory pathway component PulF